MKQDIYNYDLKLERYLKRLEESDIGCKDKILEFKDYLFMQGLSKPRVLKYIEILCTISKTLDLSCVTKKEIESYVVKIQQKNYSPWTKQIYKLVLRRFMRWLGKDELVEWISLHFPKSEKRLPHDGEMITAAEISRALASCENVRDRCLISVLFESGCRIGEIASLCISNVVFDKHGVVISVTGKTGARKIRIVKSSALLKMYIENHPCKQDVNSPLWVNIGTRNHGKQMMYGAFNQRIRKIFAKAGINKRCNPHMFRHSRATHMANHLTEFQMNQYFGWQQGSDMPSTYVHLSGRDVEGAILEMNGIKERDNNDVEQSCRCPRCEFINPPDAKYCMRCSQILDEKTAIEHDNNQQRTNVVNLILNELVKEPTIQQDMLQRVQEMGLSEKLLGLKD